MKKVRTMIIAALAAQGAFGGPAVYRWLAETARPTAQTIDVFQGETMRLEPTLLHYGLPVTIGSDTAVTLWYQTNGMGQAWWSVPASTGTVAGQVRAVFAPTHDIGAQRYTFFIQAADPDGSNYRAYGTLLMRFAPGFSPMAAPPPQYQWVTPAELQSVSNALASSAQTNAAAWHTALTNEAAIRAAAAAVLTASNAATRIVADGAVMRSGVSNISPTFDLQSFSDGGAWHLWHGGFLHMFGDGEFAVYNDLGETAVRRVSGPRISYYLGGGVDFVDYDVSLYYKQSWRYPAAADDAEWSRARSTHASREWVSSAVAAIPRVPTNAVQGWLLYDAGSNMWLRVSVSNLAFTVWEVSP